MKKALQYLPMILFVAMIALWQTGWNPFAGPLTIGTTVTPAELKQMKQSKDSDGRRVAILGRATVSRSNRSRRVGAPINLPVESPANEYIDHFDFGFGQGKNEVFIPAEFTPTDLKMFDNEKNAHPYDENVLISFTMERISAAEPEMDPKTGEYVWTYARIRIDPAGGK